MALEEAEGRLFLCLLADFTRVHVVPPGFPYPQAHCQGSLPPSGGNYLDITYYPRFRSRSRGLRRSSGSKNLCILSRSIKRFLKSANSSIRPRMRSSTLFMTLQVTPELALSLRKEEDKERGAVAPRTRAPGRPGDFSLLSGGNVCVDLLSLSFLQPTKSLVSLLFYFFKPSG